MKTYITKSIKESTGIVNLQDFVTVIRLSRQNYVMVKDNLSNETVRVSISDNYFWMKKRKLD